MDLLQWVLFGALPALAAVLLFVGVGGPRLLAPALAVAVCVPLGMVAGWPPWPWLLDVGRGEPRPWAFWCILSAGLGGAAYDLRLLPKAVMFPFELALVGFLPWLLSGPLRAGWTFERCVVMLGAAWTLLLALWWVLRAAAKLQPGMAVPLAGAIALLADTLVLRARTEGAAWHLAGVAVVALGVSVGTSLWRRPFVCRTGGTLAIAMVHVAVLWCGRTERQLVQAPFLLALVAPLAMWVVTWKTFAEGRTTGMLVGLCACAAVAGCAIWMA